MDSKKVKMSLAALMMGALAISGCSSKKSAPEKRQTPSMEVESSEGDVTDALPPATTAPQDLPPETPAEPAAPIELAPPVKPKAFAVWIDGAGLESIQALGFLQELERAGHKPVKIVGTGFGCWVAVSWALENSGNRAEWQAFKWNNWDHIQHSGLLGKLTLRNVHSEFDKDMQRLLPARQFSNLALSADCPALTKSRPQRLVSSRAWDLSTALWYQFMIPVLGADTSQAEVWSGLAAGTPSPEELDEMASDIPRDNADFAGWFVLRTRNAADRAGSGGWAAALAERADRSSPNSGKTPGGSSWAIIDMSGGPGRPAADIQNFDKRREFLLEGRRVGNNLVHGSEWKGFFE